MMSKQKNSKRVVSAVAGRKWDAPPCLATCSTQNTAWSKPREVKSWDMAESFFMLLEYLKKSSYTYNWYSDTWIHFLKPFSPENFISMVKLPNHVSRIATLQTSFRALFFRNENNSTATKNCRVIFPLCAERILWKLKGTMMISSFQKEIK